MIIAETLEQALEALAAGARPIAGGSDLVVAHRSGKAPLPAQLVAIDRLEELSSIEQGEDGVRIGAVVNHARLVTHPLIIDTYPSLADAAALVGSPATRNVGTIGGNVMNGSPAMDTGAPLVVLGAKVALQSTNGYREIDVADLWTDPGVTSAEPDELCVALSIPTPQASTSSAYVRLEYRRAMEIAVVGAACSVTLSEGVVSAINIALTAVAPTIVAVDGLEGAIGQPPQDVEALVQSVASEQASPISDLRAGAEYRRQMVGVMAKRSFAAAVARAQGEAIAVPVNRSIGIGA
jgi:CO/xanthine dehydrogenase FAD-binding subunit